VDKRYQVFVSSTYEDLREERQEVMQALLELDCMPSGMELFPAANEDQWTLIKKVIDDCDYYLVIVGGRYGSIGADGKSYTQMEYEYALSKGKPAIAFLHADPSAIAAGRTEKTEVGKQRLEGFRELAKKKMVKYWKTPHELGSVVSRSLIKLIKTNPATGWVRADEIAEGAGARELLRLRKEIDELQKRLQQSTVQAPTGTEALSFGEDEFSVGFDAEFVDGADGADYTQNVVIRLTWNRIFGVLAPLMIDRATASELEAALAEDCKEDLEAKIQKDTPKAQEVSAEVQTDSTNTIVIQLRALGLIKKDDSRIRADGPVRWTLTPYGDTMMTKILAIHREANGASAVGSD
jgi:hypothetical protein